MEQTITQTQSNPPIKINKHDSKYLNKAQTRKAQFLYENDYFIWNEAEMYLRVCEIEYSYLNILTFSFSV